ncbi:MAG: glycosyltransferase family 2 protein [Candidatus Krumholzibacteria bacterium]|nr:glycosyltransferase family 2 protein [Candidatus Krumholzibacteria bacterium]
MDRAVYAIVLNWNGRGVIGPCLASLMRISDPSLEIIVVDNASSDDSAEIVRRDAPEAELIVNDRNLLFAEGNNVGIRRAIERGGSLFLLLNNDTEVDPAFVARMLEALERDPAAGIVGPKIVYDDDPKRIWYGGGGFFPFVWIPKHENIRKIDGSFPERGGETLWVSGCAMLVKREVLDAVGLLDPSYRIYCEDVDFCLRARRAGWKCLYEPRALVRHKVSFSSGGGMTPFKLENRIASTFRLYRRFKPLWWRILMAPAQGALFALLAVGLLLGGRFGLLRGAMRGAARLARGA